MLKKLLPLTILLFLVPIIGISCSLSTAGMHFGSTDTSTATNTAIPTSTPSLTPTFPVTSTNTATPIPMDSSTPPSDPVGVVKYYGFTQNSDDEKNCATACQSFQNLNLNMIVRIYENGSFLVVLIQDPSTDPGDQAKLDQNDMVANMLVQLYPFDIVNDVMTAIGNHDNKSGSFGNYDWSLQLGTVSVNDKSAYVVEVRIAPK